MPPLAAVLALGFGLGLRHAADSDHVAAVSAIVARHRRLGTAWLLGAAWGLGHSATMLAVGGAIVLLKVAIPARAGLASVACGLWILYQTAVVGGLFLADPRWIPR